MNKQDTPKEKGSKFEWRMNNSSKKSRKKTWQHKMDIKKEVVEIIDGARKVIIASSFLLADKNVEDALINASDRGVRCYVMTAAEHRLVQKVETEFDDKVRKAHVKTLKRLAGKILVRTSPQCHAKVILADPSKKPKGMMMTANLTNEALTRNKELAVMLTENEVRQCADIMRWSFWSYSDHELKEVDRLMDCEKLNVEPVPTKNILQTEHFKSIEKGVLDILRGNPKTVTVSSFGWDEGHSIVTRLCKLSKQGSKVTVIARPRDSTLSAMIKMKNAGIHIIGFKWLHAKAVVSSSGTIIMSANIEKRGMEEGFELGINLVDDRAEKVRKNLEEWIQNPEYGFY